MLRPSPRQVQRPSALPLSPVPEDAARKCSSWRCKCRQTDYTLQLVRKYATPHKTLDPALRAGTAAAVRRIRDASEPLCAPGLAFNPVDNRCWPHAPIFSLFRSTPLQAEPDSTGGTLIHDAQGIVRPWAWDCERERQPAGQSGCCSQYPCAADSPSRAVDCVAGGGLLESGQSLATQQHHPILIEEEYFEWQDMLLAAASATPGGTFVAVEIGARYGPWAMKGVAAARSLGISSNVHALLVEPMPEHVAMISSYFAMNHFGRDQYTVVPRPFGKGLGLARLLANWSHVDMLDCDAQGAEERLAANPLDAAALREKVYRVHVEGHPTKTFGRHPHRGTLEVVEAMLRAQGFVIMRNATSMYSEYRSPSFGRVLLRGAFVYAVNPRFRDC